MQGSSRTRAYYDFRYGVAVGEFESIGSVVGSATLVAVEEMTLRGPSPSVLFRLADDSGVGEFADGLA